VIISYHDLVCFDPLVDSPCNNALIDQIGKAFGNRHKPSNHGSDSNDDNDTNCSSSSLGILAVQDMPQFVELRHRLLPLAARIPSLPDLQDIVLPETLYSTGWSHGKEQFNGKADMAKGSFYANPLHDSLLSAMITRHNTTTNNDSSHDNDSFVQELKIQAKQHPEFYANNIWPNQSLPELRQAFMDLGQCMVETGRLLAAVCDAYCIKQQQQGKGTGTSSGEEEAAPTSSLQLYKTLTESLNCKGRLLHYFPVVQQEQLLQQEESSASITGIKDDDENLWCGWHNDHVSLILFACHLCCRQTACFLRFVAVPILFGMFF
jgi:hypothetical protein